MACMALRCSSKPMERQNQWPYYHQMPNLPKAIQRIYPPQILGVMVHLAYLAMGHTHSQCLASRRAYQRPMAPTKLETKHIFYTDSIQAPLRPYVGFLFQPPWTSCMHIKALPCGLSLYLGFVPYLSLLMSRVCLSVPPGPCGWWFLYFSFLQWNLISFVSKKTKTKTLSLLIVQIHFRWLE